ncbi:MAG TPA: Rpn family recombination-promoting nuclease/putative transposase [Allocoleopsis sp.]
MRTDSIFYKIFLNFPQSFFELINRPGETANLYEFTSREVKQLSFRLDGLFLPRDPNSTEPFYIVEVQFQPNDIFYYRLFAEFFLFLRDYQPPQTWQLVVIYPNRNIEREQTHHFGNMLSLNQVTRIYLNELGEEAERSLGIQVIKLIIESENQAVEKAKKLISETKQQVTDIIVQKNLIDLIQSIIVYKLPQKSRKEIEAMFGLTEMKQTKFYQEAQLETKLETLLRMIRLGLSLEVIAQSLDLPLEIVQKEAEKANN